MQTLPDTRDLVLVGGGHAHALVLKRWGMDPLPGARLTLIDPGATTAYTGMLPGLVAGHYRRDETEIEFGPRFVHQLRRRLEEGVPPWRRKRRPTLRLEIPQSAGRAVEGQVLEALARDGKRGFFSENRLWKSLFGLAFWDILF
ncbi:MAG: hypothetical protein ACU0BS_05915, partial [Hasllibacter sp.]